MKNLSLLIAAGALATTFSGCYIDRTPTMTMEERSMASDKEIAEYEAKKAAEGSKKTAPVEVKAVASTPTGEIDSAIPATDRRFGEYSGRKFMTGIVWSHDGVSFANLEVWAQSTSGAWKKIVSAEFNRPGFLLIPSLDERPGFVTVMELKDNVVGAVEVFRYNLNMAPR